MKSIKLLTFASIALGLASCSPKYYSPNTQNVPLITEQGETNLTLAAGGNQVEFQGAYGIGKNIAIKTNAGLFIPKNLDNGNGGSGNFLELGFGYFKPIEKNWVFETYGLCGFGNMENHLPSTKADFPNTKGDISANVIRFGIQPNFGYKSKNFSAAFSSRFVNLMYSNIKGDLMFENMSQVDYLKNNSSNFLIEPAFTIRAGFDQFKLQAQVGYSLNLSNSNFRQDQMFVTVGINFNFRKM